MSPIEAMKKNMKLLTQDRAFQGCISACQKEGATEASQIVANGIAMIAWGLSVAALDGEHDDLKVEALELVAKLEPVRLREAA